MQLTAVLPLIPPRVLSLKMQLYATPLAIPLPLPVSTELLLNVQLYAVPPYIPLPDRKEKLSRIMQLETTDAVSKQYTPPPDPFHAPP